MTFQNPINTENIEDRDFSAIPAGWYGVQVVSTKDSPTSTGGMQTSYEYKILGPKYVGRKVFSNHNVVNSSVKAQEIAYEEIGRLGKACGVANIRDTADVVGKICEVEVKCKTMTDGSIRNEVVSARKPTSQYEVPSQPAPNFGQPAQTPNFAQTPGANAPWFSKD